jgi:glycosyltransferase involved in cell wall biosynthesis
VEFVPPIYDRAALAAELQQADWYCYPSIADRGETFGVAPAEAMATGLPCVVSALTCFRDFVDPGRNALVFDHRASDPVQELTRVLGSMIDDPSMCRALSGLATQIRLRFGYPAIADRFIEDFYELLDAGEAGG